MLRLAKCIIHDDRELVGVDSDDDTGMAFFGKDVGKDVGKG